MNAMRIASIVLATYLVISALTGERTPRLLEVVDRVLPCHDLYWKTEEAMAEGNPVLMLERGRDWRTSPLYGTYGGALLYADRRALHRPGRAGEGA